MLSINKCKQILESGGEQYSEDEVRSIRDLLYDLAALNTDEYINGQNHEESSVNGKSQLGRAGERIQPRRTD